MKKILYILLLGVVGLMVISCKDDDADNARSIEFMRSIYFLPSDTSTTVNIIAGTKVDKETRVQFTISGSAIIDDDYVVSAKEFVIPAGSNKASVVFTPKYNRELGREIRLELKPVDGYVLGPRKSTVIPVAVKEVLSWSFTTAQTTLVDETVIEIKLFGAESGNNFKASSDLRIPVKILPSSTAALGTHFIVKGGGAMEIVVRKGSNIGRMTLKTTEFQGEPPILNLILDPTEEGRYTEGDAPECSILVTGLVRFKQLEGTWTFEEFVSEDDDDFTIMWLMMLFDESGDDPEKLPMSYNKSDKLTFTITQEDGVDVCKMTPEITGSLADILRPCTIATPEAWKYLHTWLYETYYATTYTMSTANRLFSPVAESLGETKITFRLLENGTALEVWVVDYVPTYFGANLYAVFGNLDPTTFYLRWRFRKQ